MTSEWIYDPYDRLTKEEEAFESVWDMREAEYARLIREEAELDYRNLPTEGRLVVEPDAEFQLLSYEHDELKSEVDRHHRDFDSISALCTLWRNGVINGDDALKFIQNIVG